MLMFTQGQRNCVLPDQTSFLWLNGTSKLLKIIPTVNQPCFDTFTKNNYRIFSKKKFLGNPISIFLSGCDNSAAIYWFNWFYGGNNGLPLKNFSHQSVEV
jgi:hypothetical protein